MGVSDDGEETIGTLAQMRHLSAVTVEATFGAPLPDVTASLLQMLGAAIHLNHWLMDTSLLHHIALAPTVAPDWGTCGIYVAAGAAAAAAGAWRFHHRDLQTG